VKLIETKTLTGVAASIEFTAIPQDGTDLVVLIGVRCSGAFTFVSGGLIINSAAADTSWRRLSGNGSSPSIGSATAQTDYYFGEIPANNATSNVYSNSLVYIPNYTGSQQKSISSDSVTENNATLGDQIIVAGLCTKTAAVTSLTVRVYGGSASLNTGSTVSLYKITKGTDGIVTVS
jgi:hypothetical protein